MNDIGRVTVKVQQPLVWDAYQRNHATGSFIIIDELTNNTVAAGMICPAKS
jgi:sulfate adenylyltransferase subunit 1